MQQLARMADASNPDAIRSFTGFAAIAGYIGGDTPHVWSRAEWAKFGKLPKLPIYVRSNPSPDKLALQGEADGWAALKALLDLGVPPGKAVVYDIETLVVPALVLSFRRVVEWAGFRVWLYGSTGNLFQNPALSYWPATANDQPKLYPGKNVRATQYMENVPLGAAKVDISVIRRWQLMNGRLWT